ncbi:MAG TPA: hypothetical protein VHX38_20035 [Pseudonocardiaceae bacterium]|jgi:hypothetical protein|nr:hypothetical protein [Pseudonocardiaceae bacterium]
MKQSIVLRCALAAGAVAGVVAISACTPTSSGAPASGGSAGLAGGTAAQASTSQPVAPSAPVTASGGGSAAVPTPVARTPIAPKAITVPEVATVAAPAHIYYPMCAANGSVKSPIEVTNMIVSCDSTVSLSNVHWATWNNSYAEGTGELLENDCEPDCATGATHSSLVSIRFDKPVQVSCGEFWSEAVFTYLGKPPPGAPQQRTNSAGSPSSYC